MGMREEALSILEGGNSRPAGPHLDAFTLAPHQDPQLGRWQPAEEGGNGGDQDHLNLDRFFNLFQLFYLLTIDRKRYLYLGAGNSL